MNFVTTKRAAEILGISDSRMRQLILAGRLPAKKIGRDWLIREKDLAKMFGRRPGRPRKS
jgi:excisionase family DNA binding protein